MMWIRRPGRWFHLIAGILLVAPICGCATDHRRVQAPLIEPPRRDDPDILRTQAAAAWRERSDPERLLEATLLWKKVIGQVPDDRATLLLLARALCFMADAQLVRPEERLTRYEQGAYYAERALGLNPEFNALREGSRSLAEAVAVLGDSDLEAALWTLTLHGRTARLRGTWALQEAHPALLALLNVVSRLQVPQGDPDGMLGDPARRLAAWRSLEWAIHHAVMPTTLGGNLKLARVAFDEAIGKDPELLEARVLFAELYAIAAGDRKVFRLQLEAVLASAPSAIPSEEPERSYQRSRAEALLKRERDLFPRR